MAGELEVGGEEGGEAEQGEERTEQAHSCMIAPDHYQMKSGLLRILEPEAIDHDDAFG